jgi:hypothetical protein
MRDELLAIEQFDILLEAQVLVAHWRSEYNCSTPPWRCSPRRIRSAGADQRTALS